MGFMKNMLSKLKKGVQEMGSQQHPEVLLPGKTTEADIINQAFTTEAFVIPPKGMCTICGMAPMAVLIPHPNSKSGAMVWACKKKAHQAASKDRQELKKFKQLQTKMEQRGAV